MKIISILGLVIISLNTFAQINIPMSFVQQAPIHVELLKSDTTLVCGDTICLNELITGIENWADYGVEWSPDSIFTHRDSLYQQVAFVDSCVVELKVFDSIQCSKSLLFNINVVDSLKVKSIISDATCWGKADGEISLEIGAGAKPYKVNWSNGDTTTWIDQVEAGEYSVIISDSIGQVVEQIFVVNQPDVMDISYNFDHEKKGVDWYRIINLQVHGGTQPYTYHWQNGFDSISNLVLDVDSAYTVLVKDAFGCSDSITIQITAESEINRKQEFDFTLFPNPSDGMVSLRIEGAKGEFKLMIVNLDGQLVWEDQFELSAGLLVHLPRLELKSGNYLVTLMNRNRSINKKLIIK